MQKGNPPKFRNGMCSECGTQPRAKGQRYCKSHHNAKKRQFRKEARKRLLEAKFAAFVDQWYERIKSRHPDVSWTLAEFRESVAVVTAAEVWPELRK